MQENFAPSLVFVLKEEGGNDDDPQDHGGRTSRGIIQRVYDSYRKRKGQAPADVWKASQAEVEDIYKTQYWRPYCDDLPAGIDLAFFDFCVNAGRQQAVKCLQRALKVPVDGMMGQQTLAALEQHDDPGSLIHAFCERRRAFYRGLRQFPRYGRGWIGRTDRCEKAAAALADTVPVAASSAPKANPNDVATPPVSAEAAAGATTGSTVGFGVMDQIQQATTHLQQFSDTIMIVKYVLAALALVSVGFTVYAVIHKQKMAALQS